jgi:hypothetical protein
MTTDRSHSRPPRWAESLLRGILAERDRETVTGDLLEEYREAIVPEYGAAAHRWYILQVAGYLARRSASWGIVIGSTLVVRYVFDTLVPVADYRLRAQTLSYTIIAVSALVGLATAWRARSFSVGVLTSFSASAIGALLSIVGGAMILAIWHDQAALDATRASGGLTEIFIDVPLKLIAIGTVIGTTGALVGKAAAALPEKLAR